MSLQHPEDILRHAVSTFGEATKGLAEIKIGSFTSSNKEFVVYAYLKSKYVNEYKIDCITIRFPLSIYPLKVKIDNKKIAALFVKDEIVCSSKVALCEAIEMYFLSKEFTQEVQTLVNIAAMNKSRS